MENVIAWLIFALFIAACIIYIQWCSLIAKNKECEDLREDLKQCRKHWEENRTELHKRKKYRARLSRYEDPDNDPLNPDTDE